VEKSLTKGIKLFDNTILLLKNKQLVLIIKDNVKIVQSHLYNQQVFYIILLTALLIVSNSIPLGPISIRELYNNEFGKFAQEYLSKHGPIILKSNRPDLVKLLKSKLNDSFSNDKIESSIAKKFFKMSIDDMESDLLDEILVPLIRPIIGIFLK
jgi:hypothetical protein